MEIGSIFLGNTPNEQRKWLREALALLKSKGFNRLVIPCCGQFAVAQAAVSAGWPRDEIETSDISLFSTIIGNLCAGRPIDEIGFEITKPDDIAEYNSLTSDTDKAAFVLWLIKSTQIRTSVYYDKMFYDDLIERKAEHIKAIKSKIECFVGLLSGISYEVKDMREYFEQEYTDKTVVVINPPAFKNGYTKMFQHAERVKYDPNIPEFDFAKEYRGLYEKSKESDAVFFWYRYKEVKGFNPDEVCFGKEYTNVRQDFWLCTKPRLLENDPIYKTMATKLVKHISVPNYRPFLPDDEIRLDSSVNAIPCTKEVSFYYRDLWAHKLGVTNAQQFYLIFIDGKIVATVGFDSAQLRRLIIDKVFEVFCFNASSALYPKLNRLVMMFLTCQDMKEELMRSMFKSNRLYDLNGIKTTCLSKYRKVRLNNGILKVVNREQMKNGMYRIVYETEWHNRTFQDCIKVFLKECEQDAESN